MRPFARITAGGADVSARLGDRLLSIECFDEAEDKSDRVEIEIDNRASWTDAAVVSIPIVGTVVDVVMGYRDGAAARRGSYKIDQITVSAPPARLRVTGRSADLPSKFRTPRSESYHQKTLGKIVQDVAKRNGFKPVIDPELSGIVVRHVDQNRESDMSFATRLAKQYDAVARPVQGRLVLAKRGSGKAAGGEQIPTIGIRPSDCVRYDFDYSARDEAGEAGGLPEKASADGASQPTKGGVRAFWTDIRTGLRERVEIGEEPFSELRETFHNEAEAKAAASEKKNSADRGKCSFSCQIGGRVGVQAEATLILSGFLTYIPTKWRIKSASHRFAGEGYTTDIVAELYQPAQKQVAKEVKATKPTKDDKVDPDAPEEPINSDSGAGSAASADPNPGGEEYIIDLPSEA